MPVVGMSFTTLVVFFLVDTLGYVLTSQSKLLCIALIAGLWFLVGVSMYKQDMKELKEIDRKKQLQINKVKL